MTDNHRDLAYRLSATAGQSSTLNPRQLADRAHRLHTAVREIPVIAEAAMIAVNSGINQSRD